MKIQKAKKKSTVHSYFVYTFWIFLAALFSVQPVIVAGLSVKCQYDMLLIFWKIHLVCVTLRVREAEEARKDQKEKKEIRY